MKLRNLLFGTMIACAFASCSNEDDPIVNGNPSIEGGNASLLVAVKNLSDMATKAGEGDANAKDGDSQVNTLKVVLYDATTGAYLLEKDVLSSKVVKFEGLQAGRTLKAFAVANIDQSFDGTNTNTLALTATAASFSTSSLPMSSGLTTEFTLEVGDNYCGYQGEPMEGKVFDIAALPLIRNVARVQLGDLIFDMKKAVTTKYISGTAAFQPKAVFIMHGRTMTKIADLSATAADFGTIAAAYEPTSTDFVSGKIGFTHSFGTADATNYNKVLTGDKYVQNITSDAGKTYAADANVFFYVFENRNTTAVNKMAAASINASVLATELVIEGTFSLDKAQLVANGPTFSVQEQTSYWPIVVGVDGIAGNVKDGIHRNTVYTVNATLAGRGLKDPTIPDGDELTDLFVKTTVVNWNTAVQAPVVE